MRFTFSEPYALPVTNTTWPADGRYAIVPERSTVTVFTFKDGLLSPLAHDLELHTQDIRGDVELGPGKHRVQARIDLWSLTVREGILSPAMKSECERMLRSRVLRRRDHAQARIDAHADGDALRGTLHILHGSAPVVLPLRISDVDDRGFTASLRHELRQTDFGITPYRAMMGTLKVKDRDSLRRHLASCGIETKVCYELPLHRRKEFGDLGFLRRDYPVCENIYTKIVSLPISHSLSKEQIDLVCREFKNHYQ